MHVPVQYRTLPYSPLMRYLEFLVYSYSAVGESPLTYLLIDLFICIQELLLNVKIGSLVLVHVIP